MGESKADRDSQYRIAALNSAILRAGQDGGISGGIDVYALANANYQWLTGKTDLKDPVAEKVKKKKPSKDYHFTGSATSSGRSKVK